MATQDMLEFAIVLYDELHGKALYAIKGEAVKATPYRMAELASSLIRAATSLHKRYEAACSYDWACTDAYEHATDRKEAAVLTMLKPYGITARFGRDPRGATIALQLPSGLSNGWGNDGYIVPTRKGR